MDPTDETLMSDGGLEPVAAILALIGVLGIVNNSTTLYLVGRYKQLRTPFNILMVNLSVSDLLMCVLGTPFSFVSSLHGRWMFGHSGCEWYGFICNFLGIVSLITLTVISYERYLLMKRLPNERILSYRAVALAVVFIWCYSLLWTAPPLVGWSSYGPEGYGISCSVNWESRTANDTSYIVAYFVGCLVFPVAIIVISYTRLILYMRQQQLPDAPQGAQKQAQGAQQQPQGAQQQAPSAPMQMLVRREKRVTKMVVVMIMGFTICWTPYTIVALIVTCGGEGIITPAAATVPALFAKSSVVYNAAIYVAMNNKFRKCFLRSLNCRSQPRDPSSQQYTLKTNQVGMSTSGSQAARTADRIKTVHVATANPQDHRSSSAQAAEDNGGFRKCLTHSLPLNNISTLLEAEK
ncbi:pinopsin-like [Branchiostoma floridae x Branchiostoma japonicum]